MESCLWPCGQERSLACLQSQVKAGDMGLFGAMAVENGDRTGAFVPRGFPSSMLVTSQISPSRLPGSCGEVAAGGSKGPARERLQRFEGSRESRNAAPPAPSCTQVQASPWLGADVRAGSGVSRQELGPVCVPEPCVTHPRAQPSIPVSCLEQGALGAKFSFHKRTRLWSLRASHPCKELNN